MNMRHLCASIVFGLSAALLNGCGLDPVQPDQELSLQPGEGIAAVAMDTVDPINDIYIESPDNKKAPSIDITRAAGGVRLFVFAVPAGTYCVVRFHYMNVTITQDDPTHGVCFDVVAGKVAYSGNLSPRGQNGRIYTYQNYDWPAFQKMFKEQYPKLAAYPVVTP